MGRALPCFWFSQWATVRRQSSRSVGSPKPQKTASVHFLAFCASSSSVIIFSVGGSCNSFRLKPATPFRKFLKQKKHWFEHLLVMFR